MPEPSKQPGGRAGTPVGTPVGTPAGTPSGTPAGTPSGTPAGTPSGTPAGTPDLTFRINGAEPVPHAAAPTLALKLSISNADPTARIHSIMLQCQARIETTRRRYTPAEQDRMLDLFGEPSRWAQTLHSMLWARTTTLIPPFVGGTLVNLHLPCTFDFNVAATKYFHGLQGGEVPLSFLFSGTVFYPDPDDHLHVAQIPWDKDAAFCLPVQVWKEMMDHYYPNSAWLRVRRDVFDRLHHFKSANAIPTWDRALEHLLNLAQGTGDAMRTTP